MQAPNSFLERIAASALTVMSDNPVYEASIITKLLIEQQLHDLWVDDVRMRTRVESLACTG